MKPIRIKRVYGPAEVDDRVRILVERSSPRGIRKEGARFVRRPKEVAPSPGLRRWFGWQAGRSAALKARQIKELATTNGVDEPRGPLTQGLVTLLCAAHHPGHNNAAALAEYLHQR